MRLVIDTAPGRLAFGLLPDRARSPANPPEPPAFCMMLRKYLEGRRLQRAEAVPGDRIVLLFFGEQGAAGGGKDRPSGAPAMLSVELTGRTANAVLVVQGTVVGWIRQPGPGRGLALREPYTLPPPSAAPAQPPLSSAQARPASLEEAGRAWFSAFEQDRMDQRRKGLLRMLDESARRLARRIEHQVEDLRGAERAEEFRRCGELLLTYASRIPPGAGSVVLPPADQPTGEAEVTIRLDPALSVSANAQAYFRRYQKARRAVSVLQGELARSRQLLAAVETLQVLAREADSLELLEALEAERTSLTGVTAPGRHDDRRPVPKSAPARRNESPAGSRAPAIARFRSSDGVEILVGKSARANDHLTLHLARPGHVWLHARGLPGAHVVIRSHAERIPERTLLEAATLAARFSAQGRSGTAIPVDYTLCRHVRKPPGSPPGFVVYDHEKTVRVIPHPSMLPAPEPGSPDAAGGPSARS